MFDQQSFRNIRFFFFQKNVRDFTGWIFFDLAFGIESKNWPRWYQYLLLTNSSFRQFLKLRFPFPENPFTFDTQRIPKK